MKGGTDAASDVVLGLGNCVDYELKLSGPVLHELVLEHAISRADLSTEPAITSERQLVISILTYLRRGDGGEHFVGAAAALDTFSHRFPHKVALGGTSVRAGVVMSRLGVPSTLHLVSLNSHVRQLLPPDCRFISATTDETLYPHLIVQYDQGIGVRANDIDIRAPASNRLIYVNDPANEELPLSPELDRTLAGAKLFLVSGFNAVRDEVLLRNRLDALITAMLQLPAGAFVYFEDAAYHEPLLRARVRDALVGLVDIHGLNEDEFQAYLGRSVELLSVDDVSRALADLRTLIPAPTLVVHTSRWSAAVGDNAETYLAALDQGMAIASTRYRYGDDYDDARYQELRAQARREDATAFSVGLRERMGAAVCCRPGFQITATESTTVGLGDTFVGGFLASLAKRARFEPAVTSADR